MPDLLIRGKGNGNLPMGNFRMAEKIFRHGHNLSDTCFIIGAEKCGTVCYDQLFTRISRELGELLHAHENLLLLIEADILAVIICYASGLHIFSGKCR